MPRPRDVVEAGYDAVSTVYRGDEDDPPEYRSWVDLLLERLPAGSSVLDAGCGCGNPVARELSEAGHDVVGIDLSAVQVERARRLVPRARFRQADLAEVAFPPASFDAVVCLYTLIHLADDEQQYVLARMRDWLRPGGTLLTTVGAVAWTGSELDWLGTGATMWWSHPHPDTIRRWITDLGLIIERDEHVPEVGSAGHQLLVARM